MSEAKTENEERRAESAREAESSRAELHAAEKQKNAVREESEALRQAEGRARLGLHEAECRLREEAESRARESGNVWMHPTVQAGLNILSQVVTGAF